jgi:hypothetical protein
MIRNVALMGRAGAGKDTAAAILAERFGHVRVAFADPLRRMALAVDPIIDVDIAAAYYATSERDDDGVRRLSDVVERHGWDGAKRRFPEVRRFLQRLGSEGVRDVVGASTWVDIAHRTVRAAWLESRPVVLTDVRFPNEVAYARRYGLRLVWIDRPGVGDGEHASEAAVGPRDADLIVRNDGTVDGLACAMGVLVD